jgi:hypothetical protein
MKRLPLGVLVQRVHPRGAILGFNPPAAFDFETIHFGTTCQLCCYPFAFKGSCSM